MYSCAYKKPIKYLKNKMSSKNSSHLDKYFKKANNQSKRKVIKLDIAVDISSEVSRHHAELAALLLGFEGIVDRPNNVISASSVNDYAQESVLRIESEIVKLVNKYPKYYWKFYLTALPKKHFSGRLETTFLFAIKMIESCISFSEKEIDECELYKDGNNVCLEIDEVVVDDYCKLVGYSALLGDVYTLIRISSKGCDFQFNEDKLLPVPIYEQDVFESINLFDRRNVVESEVSTGMNLPSKSGFSLKQKNLSKLANLLILANERMTEEYDYIPKSAKKLKDTKYTKINFGIIPISLETVYSEFDFGSEKLPWEVELLEVVGLLQFITTAILQGWIFLPDIVEKGYILLSKGFVDHYLHDFIGSVKKYQSSKLGATFTIDAAEILRKYSKPQGERIYPANTSIVFDAGKMLGFDLSSSFEFLFDKLEYTKAQGNIANLRGLFFEKQTQDVIDSSKFKPEAAVRALVAKPLRLNNKQITDFDAILVVGRVVVAVSCKSLLVNEAYDKGDYKAIRNLTSSIEKYVGEWRSRIKQINDNKVGDNYDFSDFDEVIGLVVAPAVLYCSILYRNELLVEGLYECMSSNEFERWVSRAG